MKWAVRVKHLDGVVLYFHHNNCDCGDPWQKNPQTTTDKSLACERLHIARRCATKVDPKLIKLVVYKPAVDKIRYLEYTLEWWQQKCYALDEQIVSQTAQIENNEKALNELRDRFDKQLNATYILSKEAAAWKA